MSSPAPPPPGNNQNQTNTASNTALNTLDTTNLILPWQATKDKELEAPAVSGIGAVFHADFSDDTRVVLTTYAPSAGHEIEWAWILLEISSYSPLDFGVGYPSALAAAQHVEARLAAAAQ
jgi:hypothetical protein